MSSLEDFLQSDMFDEDILADIALRRMISFRLNFWINICQNPVSHGNYYWNTSPEHRLIAMLAISALLNQIPLNLNADKAKNYFTVAMVRMLTHISERKIQRIVKIGIEREDLTLLDSKPPKYQGSKQLLILYKDFEKSWIDSQKEEIKLMKKRQG
jgi:hypothetical protein